MCVDVTSRLIDFAVADHGFDVTAEIIAPTKTGRTAAAWAPLMFLDTELDLDLGQLPAVVALVATFYESPDGPICPAKRLEAHVAAQLADGHNCMPQPAGPYATSSMRLDHPRPMLHCIFRLFIEVASLIAGAVRDVICATNATSIASPTTPSPTGTQPFTTSHQLLHILPVRLPSAFAQFWAACTCREPL
jgi:hypothetical protein